MVHTHIHTSIYTHTCTYPRFGVLHIELDIFVELLPSATQQTNELDDTLNEGLGTGHDAEGRWQRFAIIEI